MLNYIWLGLILAAVIIGGINGSLDAVSKEAFDRVEFAVMKLALPLAGIMALWLGVMRLAEKAGLIRVMAHVLSPAMRRLFPDVPPDHPAMGSMLMNMAANMLGLNNAATPLGLRAMKDLEMLNPRPGTATNAMCTFLAINTSSIQLIPATAVAVLAVAGSSNPTAIIGTSIMATTCSTVAGVVAVKLLEKLPGYRLPPLTDAEAKQVAATVQVSARSEESDSTPSLAPLTWAGKLALICFAGVFVWAFLRVGFQEVLGLAASAELAKDNAFVRAVNGLSVI
jgi:spore maturation protein A